MAEFPKSRDLNQWQKLLVDIAMRFAGDERDARGVGKKHAAVDGLTSDNGRAAKPSAEKRLALARKAVQARWNRPYVRFDRDRGR